MKVKQNQISISIPTSSITDPHQFKALTSLRNNQTNTYHLVATIVG